MPDFLPPPAREFDCAECGRHITQVCGPADAVLCAACLGLPGWFREPNLRACLDPDHDGREVCERMEVVAVIPFPVWPPKAAEPEFSALRPDPKFVTDVIATARAMLDGTAGEPTEVRGYFVYAAAAIIVAHDEWQRAEAGSSS